MPENPADHGRRTVLRAVHDRAGRGQRSATRKSSGTAAKAPRIDLNTAGLDVLMALEGITPERAKAIVENRESRCYENAAELIDRKILPKAAYDKIKDKVKAGPCAQSDPPAAATDTGKRGK